MLRDSPFFSYSFFGYTITIIGLILFNFSGILWKGDIQQDSHQVAMTTGDFPKIVVTHVGMRTGRRMPVTRPFPGQLQDLR